MSQNYWNPFRDWNFTHQRRFSCSGEAARLKTTETLLGIETTYSSYKLYTVSSLKTTETLLGIETEKPAPIHFFSIEVSKLLKPF